MTLLSLYKKYVELVDHLLQESEKATSWEVRDSFRSQALSCQTRASYVAHCLALFGDQYLKGMNIPELLRQVEDKPCIQHKPNCVPEKRLTIYSEMKTGQPYKNSGRFMGQHSPSNGGSPAVADTLALSSLSSS